MWYLLLVFINFDGALSTQQFPIGEKKACEAKMKVFDQSELQLAIPGRVQRGPAVRAICIEGK